MRKVFTCSTFAATCPNCKTEIPREVFIEQRFWSLVQKTDGCWIWLGQRRGGGYGAFYIEHLERDLYPQAFITAHRFAYERCKGPIPDGLVVDHRCSVRLCVNPDHLEAVTPMVNSLRGQGIMAINARKTHCKYGHPLSGDNLRVYTNRGKYIARGCRACEKARRQKAS